jgi:hypothetical protein
MAFPFKEFSSHECFKLSTEFCFKSSLSEILDFDMSLLSYVISSSSILELSSLVWLYFEDSSFYGVAYGG